MGLFGGFKAKFTRNSNDKRTKNEVVCLKYHTISEFDFEQSREFPPGINQFLSQSTTKREVIRPTIKPRKSILTNGSFLDKSNTSRTIIQQTSRSFSSIDNIANPNYEQKLHQTNSLNAISTSSELDSVTYYENEPARKQSFGSRKGSVQKEEIKIIETSNIDNHNNIQTRYVEKSVLIALVQKSDDSDSESSSDSKTPSPLPRTEPPAVLPRKKLLSQKSIEDSKLATQNPTTISEVNTFDKITEPQPIITMDSDAETASVKSEDEYKINIVTHNTKYMEEEYSDEETYVEDEVDLGDMNYSSQAASIFFGGDDEYDMVSRPRRFNLEDKDDDRRSSAEC